MITFIISLISFINLVQTEATGIEYVTKSMNQELRLLENIFYKRRMSRYIRPTKHYSDSVDIELSIFVTSIIDLNEKTEVFAINGILLFTWMDANLNWEPKDYDDMEDITVPEIALWKPDIVHLNSVQMNDINVDAYRLNRVILHHSGHVRWYTLATLATRCPLDLTLFPFDEQNCEFLFGSWGHSSDDVKIFLSNESSNYNESSDYTESSDYNDESEKDFPLISNEEKMWSIKFMKGYVDENIVHFSIGLSRKAHVFHLSLLLPTLIILLANVSVFCLPSNASEKIILAALITKISMVMLVHLIWCVPQSGNCIPGIVLLSGTSVALAAMSVVASIITVNISRKRTPSPSFIKKIKTSWVQNALCLCSLTNKIEKTNVVTYSCEKEEVAIKQNENQVTSPIISDWHILASFINSIMFHLYWFTVLCVSIIAFTSVCNDN